MTGPIPQDTYCDKRLDHLARRDDRPRLQFPFSCSGWAASVTTSNTGLHGGQPFTVRAAQEGAQADPMGDLTHRQPAVNVGIAQVGQDAAGLVQGDGNVGYANYANGDVAVIAAGPR